jgi:hypothetical protein
MLLKYRKSTMLYPQKPVTLLGRFLKQSEKAFNLRIYSFVVFEVMLRISSSHHLLWRWQFSESLVDAMRVLDA